MREELKEKQLVVLMGGPGSEREVSLRSGAAVAQALRGGGYRVAEVDVRGPDFCLPEGTALAFIMMHGTFGEDGQIQSILEERGIPYTGEGVQGSRDAFDKLKGKKLFDKAGVPTPRWEVLSKGESPTLPLPLVIKAPREGSSVGVHLVRKPEELDAALADCSAMDREILVEELIEGRELTVGVLGDRALAVIEIRPHEGFYDFQHKYTKGASEYFCPAPLDEETTKRVQATAMAAHRALGLEIYSRIDILMRPDGSLYVLEANTIPGMTETSLLPKAAAVEGLSFGALCEEIARLSLQRFSRK